jgi:hypothetical protein
LTYTLFIVSGGIATPNPPSGGLIRFFKGYRPPNIKEIQLKKSRQTAEKKDPLVIFFFKDWSHENQKPKKS